MFRQNNYLLKKDKTHLMKKIHVFTLALLWCLPMRSKADEGMWLPLLLKTLCESDMKSKGLKLSAEDLYSVNQSSLKDAVVLFGGGCTGEVVSKKGLLFTNHHCGISQVQYHSTVQNDYIKNGFWAPTMNDELPNPGLSVTFIIRIEDVTQKVKEILASNAGQSQRQLNEKLEEFEKSAVIGTHYDAEIKAFDYNNAFYLFVTETFKDIRLVGAPPQAVGEFGGDTDNWMWPRHTGDFSVFRIYAGKDNKPAEYSKENIPYVPRASLKISTDGVQEGDFAMVYGFPGRTQQYLPAVAVEFIVNESNPAKISMRDKSLSVINAAMKENDNVRIQYTAKESRISNAWKKWKGEIMGLKNTNALEKKRIFEADFTKKIFENTAFSQKYSNLLDNFKALYGNYKDAVLAYDYFTEFYYSSGPELFKYIAGFENLVNNYESLKKEGKLDETLAKLKKSAEGFYKNLDISTDQKIFEAVLPVYLNGCPSTYHPEYLKSELTKFKNDLHLLADDIYKKTLFATHENVKAFLDKPESYFSKIKKDKAYLMALAWFNMYKTKLESTVKSYQINNEQLLNQYVAAIYEVFPDKKIWYDANSTLRVGYGNITGSQPRDGMQYVHFSTSEGILEKYRSGAGEYEIPQRLLDLLSKKEFGNYADKDGSLHTCFTSNSQTTGGNSGSPVLNAYGELIGLNFDRSWESTMSDIMYSPKLCRNIVCDIRYVLFIMDKYAGATHLINELELTNAAQKRSNAIEKTKKEIDDLTEQLRINPDNAVILTQRGRKYFALGMFEDALKNVNAALALKTNYADTWSLNAEICEAQQKWKDALTNIEKAVALEPNNIILRKLHIRYLYQNNQFKKCAEVCEQFSKNNNDGLVFFFHAKSQYMLNNPTQACSLYKRAKENGCVELFTELESCK